MQFMIPAVRCSSSCRSVQNISTLLSAILLSKTYCYQLLKRVCQQVMPSCLCLKKGSFQAHADLKSLWLPRLTGGSNFCPTVDMLTVETIQQPSWSAYNMPIHQGFTSITNSKLRRERGIVPYLSGSVNSQAFANWCFVPLACVNPMLFVAGSKTCQNSAHVHPQ